MEPPRPDVGAFGISLVASLATYLLTKSISLSVSVAVISLVMGLPLLLALRSYIYLGKGVNIDQRKAENLYRWLVRVAPYASIHKDNIIMVYTARSGSTLQLVQLGGVNIPKRPPIYLLHKVAWEGKPIVTHSRGYFYVIFPTPVLKRLVDRVRSTKYGVVLELRDINDVKTIYSLLRSLIQAALGVGRLVAAYMASKIFSKLVLDGVMWLNGELIERVQLPYEPIWIKIRVRNQFAAEQYIEP